MYMSLAREKIARARLLREARAAKSKSLEKGAKTEPVMLKSTRAAYPTHTVGPADVIEFTTSLEANLKSYSIDISPVQDLHGYDSPWPAGGGKNKFNIDVLPTSYVTSGVIKNNNGSITVRTSPTSGGIAAFKNGNYLKLSDLTSGLVVGETYFLSFETTGTKKQIYLSTSASTWNEGTSRTITQNDLDSIVYFYASGSDTEATLTLFQIEAGSSQTTYSPYSNICPITGWTGAVVTRTDGQDPPVTSDTYSISFPDSAGTVYGGTLTVQEDGTGELVVDRAEIDLGTKSYIATVVSAEDGNRFYCSLTGAKAPTSLDEMPNLVCTILPKKLPSDYNQPIDGVTIHTNGNFQIYCRAYASLNATQFATAMDGVMLVYELATPLTYTLTAPQVSTLLGSNVLFADAGEMSAEYYYKDTTKPTPKEKALMWWRDHLMWGVGVPRPDFWKE